jgi:acyl-CoA thioester hydrolase
VSAEKTDVPGDEQGAATFRLPVRVYYEDTDAGGVVYYANYLKFMERARTEWLRALGFEQDALAREHGVIFAVRSVNVDYRRPARFNDLLTVTSRLVEVGRASLRFAQAVTRAGEARVLCDGEVRIACVDAQGLRPRPIPRIVLSKLEP